MPRKLVIFSQTFVPDPASVGQHMADVAVEMARRGWRVKVFASARGYDDPTQRYPAHEIIPPGVEVRRFPLASFGKKSILTRGIGTASFMLQAMARGLVEPDTDGVLFSTSPPLIGIAATAAKVFRNLPIAYWAMDLNPDQLIALGKVTPDHPGARFLESCNRMILTQAGLVFALDRFMAERLRRRERAHLNGKLVVMPPWPHETVVEPVAHEQNPFRQRHGLQNKFVVMYSGNHTPANPLDTLLEAAKQLRNDESIRFLFVGGGIGKNRVEQFIRDNALSNTMSLPYQPMADLRYSLSSADVHVVSLGQNMVGIIHPCKVYGAMAVGRPILYFGPRPSHIADLLDRHPIGRQVAHGDVNGAVAAISHLRDMPQSQRQAMGHLAQQVMARDLSQDLLCGKFCDDLERLFIPPSHR